MARHRRDQQHLRIVFAALFAEMAQLAERRRRGDALGDREFASADLDRVDLPIGPRMGEAGERHQLVIGGHLAPRRGEGLRRPRFEDDLRVGGEQPHAVADIGHALVGVVHHAGDPLLPFAVQQTTCQQRRPHGTSLARLRQGRSRPSARLILGFRHASNDVDDQQQELLLVVAARLADGQTRRNRFRGGRRRAERRRRARRNPAAVAVDPRPLPNLRRA